MHYRMVREVEIVENYDVVVSGGGPAGFCAAVQAARAGMKTALIEQYGALGGVITVGGNPEIALFYAGDRQVISGIGWETVKRLEKEGWAWIPEFKEGIEHSKLGVSVNAPMMARLMDEMCLEAGVKLFLHQNVADVAVTTTANSKSIQGIIISTKSGLRMVQGNIYIDCTGDGDVAALAGADYELGEPGNGELQPGTLRFYLKNVDISKIDLDQCDRSFRNAMQEGQLQLEDHWSSPDCGYEIFEKNGNNINHIVFNSTDGDSRTLAEIEGRKSVGRIAEWIRHYVSGAEAVEPAACGVEVAARESRRILCDKYITVEDYISAVTYEDAVSYSYYPVDLHKSGKKPLHNIFLEKGRVPSIPLGAMIVKGFDNLLVAGRCISGDRLANSAFRVKASCMGMGQAAGAAAAVALRSAKSLRDIGIEELKSFLVSQGAIVPTELNK